MPSKADHAIARFTEPMETVAEKVSAANTHIASIKASTNWAAATDVQAATNAWATETTAVEAGAQSIAALEKALGVARTSQLATLRRWGLRRQGVLGAINVFCDGSKDTMTTFGVAVAGGAAPETAVVPVGIMPLKKKVAGMAAWEWFLTPLNRHGFMVQHATNPADATTYSPAMSCSKRSFRLPLQTPGATISLRVMGLDPTLPTGQTEWSGWVSTVVPG
jgi:hypothetical protein